MDTETHTHHSASDESAARPLHAEVAGDEREARTAAENDHNVFCMPSAAAIADAIIRRSASEMHR